MVFAQVFAVLQHLCGKLHGADVALGGDLRGGSHDVDLMRIFDEAHFIQNAAQIALTLGAERAVADAGANFFEPPIDLTL